MALQGGGAHGAFTWGVLDRLLEDECLEFGWVSATSAGAVNAAALACGLASGGREGARAKLRQVWEAVHQAGVPDLLRMNPFLYGLSRSGSLAQMTSFLSPYEFNPLGFDPLRRLLTDTINFDKLKAGSPVELLIAATEIASGRARLFRRHEMSVEAVLASACLPTLHHAVQIDGMAYWDGGFSANPDLVNLALESPVADTLLVQLNAVVRKAWPTGAREIAMHVNRITFNAPILREVEMIEAVREAAHASRRRRWFGRPKMTVGRLAPLATHRFHMVDAGRYTGALSLESSVKPEWPVLNYLFGVGRDEAEKWLGRHRDSVGVKSSADLKARFLRPTAADEEPPAALPPAARAKPQPPQARASAGR